MTARCPMCAEPLPPTPAERCPACGSALNGPAERPTSTTLRRAPLGLVLLGVAAITVLTCAGLVGGRPSRLRRADRLFEPTLVRALPATPPVHARAGDVWTFTVRSMHGGAEGAEILEVVRVGPREVRCRITRLGQAVREEPWQYAPRVRSEGALRVSQELLTIGGRRIDCDVVEVVDGSSGGLDNMRVWIAMDRTADAPTFPGVVRMERIEFRGRTLVEWEVAGVAPVTSTP